MKKGVLCKILLKKELENLKVRVKKNLNSI